MSYSQLSIGYASTEEDVGVISIDGDGFGFSGTYELNDNIFFGLGYSSLEYDISAANLVLYGINFGGSVALDMDTTSFLGGFHTPISDKSDLIVSLGRSKHELSALGVSGTTYSTTITAGLRSRVREAVEISGGLVHKDYSSTSDTGFSIGGSYYFQEEMSFGASYTSIDDADGVTFGITYDY